jgi:hypothetical protein
MLFLPIYKGYELAVFCVTVPVNAFAPSTYNVTPPDDDTVTTQKYHVAAAPATFVFLTVLDVV